MSTRSAGDTPPDVTVIIPTIPGREDTLERAVASVEAQTGGVSVEVLVNRDTGGKGPSEMRNRGIERAAGRWVAFLDDDDEIYPHHLSHLVALGEAEDADLVYPWFDLYIMGRKKNDQIPLRFNGRSPLGQPFDDEAREMILSVNRGRGKQVGSFIPVTVLARTEFMRAAGGFVYTSTDEWPLVSGEDWATWARMLRAGAKFVHLPERTWRWNHHGKNTSGMPSRVNEIYDTVAT